MKTWSKILIVFGAFALISIVLIYLTKSLNEQVIRSFNDINEDLQDIEVIKNNSYDNLLDQLIDYREYDDLAYEVTTISDELYDYIEEIKRGFLGALGDLENNENFDKSELSDALFFTNNSKSEKGIEFVLKIDTYRSVLHSILEPDFTEIAKEVNQNFNTIIDNKDWLTYHYKGVPIGITLTKLTELQSDIQTIKLQVVQEMIQRIND